LLPITDRDLRPAVENRLDEARDVFATVLVIAIGVDDDIGTELKTGR
jgi:hypothetical protein